MKSADLLRGPIQSVTGVGRQAHGSAAFNGVDDRSFTGRVRAGNHSVAGSASEKVPSSLRDLDMYRRGALFPALKRVLQNPFSGPGRSTMVGRTKPRLFPSFLRRQESIWRPAGFDASWIPAFAGMTIGLKRAETAFVARFLPAPTFCNTL